MSKKPRPNLQIAQQDDGAESDLMSSWNDVVSTVAMNSPVPGTTPMRYFDEDIDYRNSYSSKPSGYSPMGASMSPGDSLDMSAADFEVGAIAARRSMEKANARSRRNSIDAPHLGKGVPPTKMSASPDVGRHSRTGANYDSSMNDFPMASALSSIHRSGGGFGGEDPPGMRRYGSVDKSDGEIYSMLSRRQSGPPPSQVQSQSASRYGGGPPPSHVVRGSNDSTGRPTGPPGSYHQALGAGPSKRMSPQGYGKPGQKDMPQARGSSLASSTSSSAPKHHASLKASTHPDMDSTELSDFSDDDEESFGGDRYARGSGTQHTTNRTNGGRGTSNSSTERGRSGTSGAAPRGRDGALIDDTIGGLDDDEDSAESGDSELAQSHGVEGQSVSIHSTGSLSHSKKGSKTKTSHSDLPHSSSMGGYVPTAGKSGSNNATSRLGTNSHQASKHSVSATAKSSAASSSAHRGSQQHTGSASWQDSYEMGDDDKDAHGDDGDGDNFDNFEEYMGATKKGSSVLEKPKLSATISSRDIGASAGVSKVKDDAKGPASRPTGYSSTESGLDEAERERRRSLELIMQRWSMPNIDADTIMGGVANNNEIAPKAAIVTSEVEAPQPPLAQGTIAAGIASVADNDREGVVPPSLHVVDSIKDSAAALLADASDEDDVRYAESFEDASDIQDTNTLDFAVTTGNTSANDEVMNYSLEPARRVEEINPQKIITAIGSASMVTSVQLPSVGEVEPRTELRAPTQAPIEHQVASSVGIEPVQAPQRSRTEEIGNNPASQSILDTGLQMKSTFAQQLFSSGLPQSEPPRLNPPSKSGSFTQPSGNDPPVASAVVQAAFSERVSENQSQVIPPGLPKASSGLDKLFPSALPQGTHVEMGRPDSNNRTRLDNQREIMSESTENIAEKLQTRFFPRTTVEETRDEYQEFENTIHQPTRFLTNNRISGINVGIDTVGNTGDFGIREATAEHPVGLSKQQFHFQNQFQPHQPHNLGTNSLNRQIYAPILPIDSHAMGNIHDATRQGNAGIFATEIDSSSLGGSHFRVMDMKTGRHDRTSSGGTTVTRPGRSSNIGAWPKELALAAPSTTELHARIAVMSSKRTVKSKVANAALNRVNEARRRAQLEAAYAHRNSTALRASFQSYATGVERLSFTSLADRQASKTSKTPPTGTTSSNRGHNSGPGRMEYNDDGQSQPLPRVPTPGSARRTQQLDNSNRLLREMGEMLSQQDRGLRGSADMKAHAQQLLMRNRLRKGESRSLLDDEADAGFGLRSSIQRMRSSSAPPRQQSRGRDQNEQIDMFEPWTVHAIDAFQQIVDQNQKLSDKEMELRDRERAVQLRESMSDATSNKMASLQADRLRSNPSVDEAKLLAEIDSLKAALFQERQQSQEKTLKMALLEKSLHSEENGSRKRNIPTDPSTSDDGDKQIAVSKTEYEKLVAECLSQESLIEGLTKENERLFHVMREIQIGEKASKASFFDQQESMNKELNRLRNAVGTIPESHPQLPGVVENARDSLMGPLLLRKSADLLRAELDADATIRALRERAAIAESNMGARERELQQTIEKLRRENRELIEASARNKQLVMAEVLGEQQGLDQRINQLTSENEELKSRIVWFAENQELIETVENEKNELRNHLSILRKELKRRGASGAQVERLLVMAPVNELDGPDEPEVQQNDSIVSSANSVGKHNTKGLKHHPADLKRIKQLESLVKDLQESIMKKNPDSIASLIRAATVSESVQLEKTEQSEQITAMKVELAQAKESYERKLRSIRQEHERMKSRYEIQIAELQQFASISAINPKQTSVSGAKSGSVPAKTLTQAQARVRELELENDRLRVFYNRKLEDLQRKSEAQIRALKRGERDSNLAVHPESDDAELNNIQGVDQALPVSSKLALLEEELLRTAEELGRTKKLLEEKCQACEDLQSRLSVAPTQLSRQDGNIEMQRLIREEVSRLVGEQSIRPQRQEVLPVQHRDNESVPVEREVLKLLEAQLARLKLDLAGSLEEASAKSRAFEAERAEMHGRLHREVERSAQLSARIIALEAELQKPITPQQHHFNTLTNQLEQLEARIARREREIASSIEESKQAARLERTRLQALHEQEMREKDDQLLRMQTELEQIVFSLRQVQSRDSARQVLVS